ncbi:MAG TPA: tripartite tricarboxylate transporter substrate binding protein [Burkholderiales bacterium]|nr:tripartite tricarboxylate transporter substrate binding protein [Burkholderiales bacterium]
MCEMRCDDSAFVKWAVVLLSACAACAASPLAWAQAYPAKPVRMIVGFPVGGTADIVARILGRRLGERLQSQFVVDNRSGAGSVIGSEIAARAAPDGYTLLMISSSHAISAGFREKLPYDPIRDFAGVSLVAAAPNVVVVNPSLPVKSIGDLIELARAKPGQLNYGSSGVGGNSHLAGELLKRMANIELTHVPYKGAAPALTDVISGQAQVLLPTLPSVLSQVKAGRVRAIAVTSLKRSAALPGVPTVAESGVPGYEATNWYGVLAPAATPASIIDRLNAAIREALREAYVASDLAAQGAEPVGSTCAEFEAYLKSEIAKWTRVIRDAGLGSGAGG